MQPITKQIVKTKDRVLKMLKEKPEYRDNDEKLVSSFWWQQLKEKGFDRDKMSAFDFLKVYAEGTFLTSGDLIVRARCKLEENMPEIRGDSYNKRHGIGKEVSKEIHNI